MRQIEEMEKKSGTVNSRFLEAIEIIKREARYQGVEPKTDLEFQRMIEVHPATVTNIRTLGRSATVQQLVKTAMIFELDFNWFIRKEAPFYYESSEAKKVEERTFSNSSISNHGGFFANGNVKIKKTEGVYDFAELEKTKAKLEDSLKKNKKLEKRNKELEQEIDSLAESLEAKNKEVDSLEESLAAKNEEVHQLKDRIIGLQEKLIGK